MTHYKFADILALSGRRFGFFAVILLLTTATVGCGTSLKQYKINEALLIDQTRILENEVYQTRFALQQALRENQRLRSELAGQQENAPKGEKNPPKKLTAVNSRPDSRNAVPMATRTPPNIEELPRDILVPKTAQKTTAKQSVPNGQIRQTAPVQPMTGQNNLLPTGSTPAATSNPGNLPILSSPGVRANPPITNPVYQGNAAPVINATGYSAPQSEQPAWSPLEN